VDPPIVAGQQLSKNVTMATNTHATIEELLGASFSMQSLLYQRKVGDYFFPELLVLIIIFTFNEQLKAESGIYQFASYKCITFNN
jgi:hypothetical protein